MGDKTSQIIEAAILLFSKGGMSVPTAKIAKQAGISNGTLFNYFSTKQALIDGVYLSIKEEMAALILVDVSGEHNIQQLLHQTWGSYIHWAVQHPLDYQVLHLLGASQMLSDEVKTKSDKIFQSLSDRLEESVSKQHITNVPVEYIYDITCAQLNTAVSYAEREQLSGEKLQEIIDRSFRIYWNGLKA